jgi:hypothetical protein
MQINNVNKPSFFLVLELLILDIIKHSFYVLLEAFKVPTFCSISQILPELLFSTQSLQSLVRGVYLEHTVYALRGADSQNEFIFATASIMQNL